MAARLVPWQRALGWRRGGGLVIPALLCSCETVLDYNFITLKVYLPQLLPTSKHLLHLTACSMPRHHRKRPAYLPLSCRTTASALAEERRAGAGGMGRPVSVGAPHLHTGHGQGMGVQQT